jgi:hypothetical protein
MSDILNNISVPSKGMVQDLNPINLKQEQYKYALNAVIEDSLGNGLLLQNESSNLLCTNFPNGYNVIGNKYIIEQDRTILFLVNQSTGFSQIGEILYSRNNKLVEYSNNEVIGDCLECHNQVNSNPIETDVLFKNCNYNPIVISDCLKFDISHPIDVEYKILDCNLAIYFTDGFNERRFIYFDYKDEDSNSNLKLSNNFKKIIGYDDLNCKSPIYEDVLDCNKIKLHPDIEYPCIEIVDVVQGGSLVSGVYQFFVCYSNSLGQSLSSYTAATNPTPIFERYITTDTNYKTSKAIHLSIKGISKTSVNKYYNLVVAETIDNSTVFKLVGTFPINSSNINDVFNYTYTGNQNHNILSENDVFRKYPYYSTAKSVTKSNNYLFWSGLSGFNNMNLQRVANNIKLYWQTTSIPEAAYKNPKNTSKYRGYMRDEVYSFAIVFGMSNGEESCALHIPNRIATNDDLSIISNKDVISYPNCSTEQRNKKWQIYNTATVLGSPHEEYDDCKESIWEFGEFAYWESTEKYPNIPEVFGDLCGKNIRFHKFPDNCVSHIHDSKDGSKKFVDRNLVFPIGVKIDHASVLTAISQAVTDGILSLEDSKRISYYRIVRGNRVGNKSIIAKGLIYDMFSYNKFNNEYFYPNYPYNDLNDDVFISPTIQTYDNNDSAVSNSFKNKFINTGRYTFHSPDTHFNSPSIGTEIKIETEEYGESEGYFAECLEQAKYKFLSTGSYLLSLTFGIASALSSLEEKQCETYTVQTPSKITQGGISYKISGGSSVNSLTSGTGTINTNISSTQVTNYEEGEVTSYNDETNSYSEQLNPSTAASPGKYFPNSKTKTNTRVTTNPIKVKEVTRTSCTGTPYQILGGGLGGLLGGAVGTASQQVIYKTVLALNEMETVINLITSLLPYKNFAYQHNSIGIYNNYKCFSDLGNKIREIDSYSYLTPEFTSVNESNNKTSLINNWNRESSLYLKIKELFKTPSVVDNSRYINGNNEPYDKVYKPISSFYTSIKNYVPDQYGNIFNIEYLNMDECSFLITNDSNYNRTIFGGDTFINRFSLKIKHPFFIQTRFRMANDSDVRYQDLGNVGYPNYYFNTKGTLFENISSPSNLLSILNNFEALLGVPKNRLDKDETNKVFFYQKGIIYLYSYGIPSFLVESDVNVDYRYGENIKEKGFYPYVGNISDWLQEKNVPITEDNYYFYNNTYSKQNKESYICTNSITYQPNRVCKVNYKNRVIYSQQGSNIDNSNSKDNWLVYNANDYYDFDLSNGKLINVEGIENDKVLVRFENTFNVFNAYVTIPTTSDTIQVGNGGMFQSKPQEYAYTDLGYGGSQHTALLKTEFGHIWVDSNRGQVFNLSNNNSGLDEISKDGMRNWFEENLPFEIKKCFPNIDIDNSYNGIGICLSFDKRYKRLLVTKNDYKVVNNNLRYDEDLKEFYIINSDTLLREKIYLNNNKYLCNKSWTMSYSFYTKSWVSFHSYIPNYYIDRVNKFQSGINNLTNNIGDSSLWIHNNTNKSFQKFYGSIYPFIIETVNKVDINSKYIHSVEFMLDVIRYHNEFDWVYNKNITFNKAIVYNNNQNSGELNLNIVNKNDLSRISNYPRVNSTSTDIEVYNAERYWRFNQFFDLVNSQNNNIPIWIHNCANSYQHLNKASFNYGKSDLFKNRIRSDWYFTRFINDIETNYKFIYKFNLNNSIKSYR